MKTAVILSGCGYLDGSEIRESVLALLALSQQGANVEIFAPDGHLDEVDHLSQAPTGKQRSIIEESARIARSEISVLEELDSRQFDSLILPGGFGAAKNLSNFAQAGSSIVLNADLERILVEFIEAKKPIGSICIAPVLLAKVMQNRGGALLTVGAADSDAVRAIETMGSKHHVCEANEVVVDSDHRLISTPAYMCSEASLGEIFQGIQELVIRIQKMC
jgi:enhancing lycopene biosynthesis protein 2